MTAEDEDRGNDSSEKRITSSLRVEKRGQLMFRGQGTIRSNILKTISLILLFIFIPQTLFAQVVLSGGVTLPAPGTMVSLSQPFHPAVVKGLKVYPENPLKFDFILDKGDAFSQYDPERPTGAQGLQLKKESEKLIKYFLASLTIPEKDLWVNLSPYEKDRIIPEAFGQTDMGRDLLAQDYILKQITSSLMYPEDKLGKKFWDTIYKKAYELYGRTDIPVDTFNKVWIVPDKAVVYENPAPKVGEATAFVVEAKLKVMLEEDYVAAQQTKDHRLQTIDQPSAEKRSVVSGLGSSVSDLTRSVILPAIEKEVNEGQQFAQLRQVYYSLILATWFKRNLRESIFGKAYVGKNKIAGVDIQDKDEKQKIYNQYLEAFKKGAYNYIKEQYDPSTKTIVPHKYFSGGFGFEGMDSAMTTTTNAADLGPQQGLVVIESNIKKTTKEGSEISGVPEAGAAMATAPSAVQRPVVDNSIDPKKAEQWVEAQEPDYRDLARFLLNHVTHVSQEEFEAALQETVNDFNAKMGDKPYVLVLSRQGRSEEWTYQLALEKGLRPAKHIIKLANGVMPDSARTLLQKISDVVFMDDAVYTASLLTSTVSGFVQSLPWAKVRNLNCHLLIPFMTSFGEQRISSRDLNIKLYKHHLMPTLPEILRSDVGRNWAPEFEKIFHGSVDKTFSGMTLTYFQHKIPDFISALAWLFNGETLKKGLVGPNYSTNWVRFIPETIPPYEKDYLKRIQELPSDAAMATQSAVQRPVVDNPIDMAKAKQWVEAQEPDYRDLAQFLLNHVTHVSQEEFEATLQEAVNDFNAKMGDKPYILVYSWKGKKRSEWWTYQLALEKGLKPAKHIINSGGGLLSTSDQMLLQETPDVLFVDDAVYSGTQMSITVNGFFGDITSLNKAGLRCHFLVPFITSSGQEKISSVALNSKFYKHRLMPMLLEILNSDISQKRISEFEKIFGPKNIHGMTLTYFQHKVPDSVSMLLWISGGNVLTNYNQNAIRTGMIRFIPSTIPPYEKDYLKKIQELPSDAAMATAPTAVQRPLVDNPIDVKKAKKWVKAQDPDLRELAQFLLDHVTHITQKEFEEALQEAVDDFNAKMGDKPYILVLSWKGKKRSEWWAYQLALEKGLNPAKHIINLDEVGDNEISKSDQMLLKDAPDVVFLDDAMYSGTQMSETVEALVQKMPFRWNPENLNYHFLIPFMTSFGKKEISSKIRPKFYKHRLMPTLQEIFSSDAGRKRVLEFEDIYRDSVEGKKFAGMTLTYFQHKVPDQVSMVSWISNGEILSSDIVRRANKMPFIPETIPPYDENYLEEIKAASSRTAGSESDHAMATAPTTTVQRPVVDNLIDVEKAKKWVAAQGTPEIRELAQFLLDHVTHVSQKEFEAALQETVDDFNKKMGDKPYAFVILRPSWKGDRSEFWTYQLALEKGLKPAKYIIKTEEDLSIFVQRDLRNVNDIVFMDDAAYSGGQILAKRNRFLFNSKALNFNNLNMHFVMPFMSSYAKNKLLSQPHVFIYKHHSIPTLSEIFSSDVGKKQKRVFDSLGKRFAGLTLTYFQHKVPDYFSAFQWLFEGVVVKEKSKAQIKFIPETIPPYEKDYLKKIRISLFKGKKRKADAAMVTQSAVQRPVVDNPIDMAKAKQWVEAHKDPAVRDLVEFLLNHVTHVTQKEFEAALQETVNDFNSKMGDKPYVLLLPAWKRGRSELWTYQLALEKGLKPAKQIIEAGDNLNLVQQIRSTGIKDLILMDDAVYSGKQTLDKVYDVFRYVQSSELNNRDLNLHFVAPFMSLGVENKISSGLQRYKIGEMFVYKHRSMETLPEILRHEPERKEVFEQFYPSFEDYYQYITLTYFQHKVADSVSMLPWLSGGNVLEMVGGGREVSSVRVNFIPETIPPYDENYLEEIKAASSRTAGSESDHAMATAPTVVQRPVVDNPIDPVKAKQWVEAHDPELRDLAQFLLNHVTHVSQEEFEAALQETVNDFNAKMGDKSYILVLLRPGHSEEWTYQLALEKGLKPAKHIINSSEASDIAIRKRDQKFLQETPDVVFMDDVVYTAAQMSLTITHFVDSMPLERASSLNYHFLIPFMTSFGEQKISSRELNSKFYKHRLIPTVSKILRLEPKLKNLYKKIYEQTVFGNFPGVALTYFQHKVADRVSMSEWISKGTVFKKRSGIFINTSKVSFIPDTIPPYEENYLEKIKASSADSAMATAPTTVQRPVKDNPIDMEKAKQWVEAQGTPELRDLAQFLLNHVTHVSQKEFEEALQETVNDFNRKMGDKPYVLYLPPHGGNRSEWWTYQLALEKGLKPPQRVVRSFSKEGTTFLDEAKDIVLIDDAIYTGSEISAYVLDVLNHMGSKDVNIHFVAPFMSAGAEKRVFLELLPTRYRTILKNFLTGFFKGGKMVFYKHRAMQTLPQVFRAEKKRKDLLKQVLQTSSWSLQLMTLTYFQHKVADRVSLVSWLSKGWVYGKRGEFTNASISFIPETIPPYDEDYLKKIQSKPVDAAMTAVQRPVVDNPIDPVKAEQWVEDQEPELRDTARFLLNHMTHITQKEFEEALQETVDDFNSKMGEKPYVLIIPTWNGERSELWTYQLALEKGLKPASHVINLDTVRGEIKKADWPFLQETPDVVFMDDAVYSAEHTLLMLENLSKRINSQDYKGLQSHFLIPFMTSFGEKRISSHAPNPSFYKHRLMPTLLQMLDSEEGKKWRPQIEGFFKYDMEMERFAGVTLTYFQHKVPDGLSAFKWPFEGTIFRKKTGWNSIMMAGDEPFIPETIPPYDKYYLKRIQASRPDAAMATAPTVAQRPVVDNPIDMVKAHEWIQAQGPTLRSLAQFLLDHVTHISQKEFEEALQETVDDFNKKIGNKPYILVLLRLGRSEEWTYQLALEKGLKPAKHIINLRNGQMPEYEQTLLQEMPDVVFMDDAVYTASLTSSTVSGFEEMMPLVKSQNLNYHFLTPFMTSYGENILLHKGSKPNFYKHRLMPTLLEILNSDISQKRISEFEKIFGPKDIRGMTLTYFQHKIPDFISAFPWLFNGNVLRAGAKGSIRATGVVRFIPKTISPYEEDYLEKVQMSSIDAGMTVQRPVVDNPIDMVKAHEWAQAQDPSLRELAQFLLDHVTHITQKEFEEALQETVDDFNAKMGDKPYVLLLPAWKGDRSEWWTYQLALEKGLKPAKRILKVGNSESSTHGWSYEKTVQQIRATGISDVVRIDDASYSGKNIFDDVQTIQRKEHDTRDLNFHFITPFMSGHAENKILMDSEIHVYLTGKMVIYKHRPMQTLSDIFRLNPKLKDVFEKFFNTDIEREYAGVTLTYFQHKVPDHVSTLSWIVNGRVYEIQGERKLVGDIRFIPDTFSPYEDNYLKIMSSLFPAAAGKKTDNAMVTTSTAVQRPVEDNSIDPVKAERWVNAHQDPEIRDLAQFLLNHVTHVTQKEFEEALQETVNDFNKKMGDKPYVLVVPMIKGERSSWWTYQLALEKGLKPAQYIIKTIGGLFAADKEALMEIHDVVFTDDASYTGTQILNNVQDFLSNAEFLNIKNLNVHFVVPYMTSFVENKILSYPGAFVYQHRSMQTLPEIFRSDMGQKQKLEFERLYQSSVDNKFGGVTLTYFQHKVPDFMSALAWPIQGIVYIRSESVGGIVAGRVQFIPSTVPPYEKDYLKKIQEPKVDHAMVVQRPVVDNPIDPVKADKWVEAQEPSIRDLARFLLKHATHVSQKEFEEALQETVNDFNKKMGDKPYVAVIPETDGDRSEWWTYQLALEKGLKPAKDVIRLSWDKVSNIQQMVLADVREVVFIDDAVYSGSQMIETVRSLVPALNLLDAQDFNLHFMAPFMTSSGKSKIRSYLNNSVYLFGKSTFYQHRLMPTLSEIFLFDPQQKDVFEEFFHVSVDMQYLGTTLTYFQHKIPDDVSALSWFFNGDVFRKSIANSPEWVRRNKFIPVTIPPYEKDYLEKIQALSSDKAMATQAPGGIDLNPTKMNLQVKGNGNVEFKALSPAALEELKNATGFTPVIINIKPVESLPAFLGLSQAQMEAATPQT
ncbi:MAG: hypothetical protein HQL24_05680 [Candidatus Omnitrophica bacterium]|nr:hypothetical protein [Candidatus Omnitrophota bacterium]